jgi:hypothetical protein
MNALSISDPPPTVPPFGLALEVGKISLDLTLDGPAKQPPQWREDTGKKCCRPAGENDRHSRASSIGGKEVVYEISGAVIEGRELEPVGCLHARNGHFLGRLPPKHDTGLAKDAADSNRARPQDFDALNAGNEPRPVGKSMAVAKTASGGASTKVSTAMCMNPSRGDSKIFADGLSATKLAMGGLSEMEDSNA